MLDEIIIKYWWEFVSRFYFNGSVIWMHWKCKYTQLVAFFRIIISIFLLWNIGKKINIVFFEDTKFVTKYNSTQIRQIYLGFVTYHLINNITWFQIGIIHVVVLDKVINTCNNISK